MTDRIRLNEGNRRWWTLAAMCFALFMIMLDNTVVNVALPSIQEDLGASLSGLEWTVNAYTLTFAVLLVTGGRLGDIFGRRAHVPVRRGGVRALERGDRPRARPGLARGGPRHPGRRRGVHDAGHALDHHRHLPARGARQGDRHLGRRVRARAGDRPGRGRRAHRVRLLARDLLPQPAGGRRRRGGDAVRDARVARRDAPRTRSTGPASRRSRSASRRSCSRSSRATPGAGARPRSSACCVDRGRRARRLRADRAARARADGRLLAVPLAHLPGREHRRLHRLVLDARDVLLHRALHAEHPRLLRRSRPACASCPRR